MSNNHTPTPEEGHAFAEDILDIMEAKKLDPQVVAHAYALVIGMVMAPSFSTIEDAEEIFEAMTLIMMQSFAHGKELIVELQAEQAVPKH